jgi:hypothetical protein
MKIYRQGDVLVIRADKAPANTKPIARDNGRIVLAYGEATGHAHAILEREAELFSLPDTEDRFLRIMASSGVALVHEEHAPVTLPPGDFIVRIHAEYFPDAIRRVAD